ncbi:MAG: PH domain-containing protein [Bacteroidaceae bacterium]|nr:PH domain-containing protein [Bacteroidaceae bacterium]
MGNYVQKNLIPGESIVYEAKYHWSVWIKPAMAVALSLLLVVTAFVFFANDTATEPSYVWLILSGILLLVSLIYFGYWYLKRGFDEFAVTTQRIFIKKGIFAHETTEHNLKKIETVSVEQGFWERLFACGTLTFSGTGSTTTELPKMDHPHAFRKAIQSAMDEYDRVDVSKDEAAQQVTAQPTSTLSRAEQIEKLKQLLDSGALTQDEFETEKTRILFQE